MFLCRDLWKVCGTRSYEEGDINCNIGDAFTKTARLEWESVDNPAYKLDETTLAVSTAQYILRVQR